MPMNDIFTPDAFGLISLTDAINRLPYKPARIGEMGLFGSQGVATNTIVVEEQNGYLSLLPTVPRGAPATQAKHLRRKVRSFALPHIPLEDAILAADVQGVRRFGSENQTEGVAQLVNDRMASLRQQHEVTLEYMRMGAINGIILDGAGSTLYNLFTEFNIAPPALVNFALELPATNVGAILLSIKRTIEDALGVDTYDHIHAFCSSTFFDAFVEHPEVKYAYQYYQEGQLLRTDARRGFEYKGVVLEEYRGAVGATSFMTANHARFFPVGVPGLFQTYYGPADFMETVNTIGLPIYAKQEPMPFDRGVTLHTQSNPLPLCTRPGVLVDAKRFTAD